MSVKQISIQRFKEIKYAKRSINLIDYVFNSRGRYSTESNLKQYRFEIREKSAREDRGRKSRVRRNKLVKVIEIIFIYHSKLKYNTMTID